MFDRLVFARLLILLGLTVLSGATWLLAVWPQANAPLLAVHFLDVGQGDAIFIESPSGKQMLIDGGPTNQVLRELASEMSFFDRSIDVVLATHPDSDHIGGLIDVLARYQVATIIATDNIGDTTIAVTYQQSSNNEQAQTIVARRGQVIDLGAGVMVEVLYPEGSVERFETNRSSIVVRVVYGNTSFLLTGDAPKAIEEYLVLTHGEGLKSDVLKVGHHGSRTSTSELFLTAVGPIYAVVSAGADNRYGHPHSDVTEALFNARVETFNTAEVGTVTFLSDGITVQLSN